MPAYAAAWAVEQERLRPLQAETEADRLREQERGNRRLPENPSLRDYKPPSEHLHAMDVRHVRKALYEIQRPNCPPAIKQEQRRRLKELEQIWSNMASRMSSTLPHWQVTPPHLLDRIMP